MYGDGSIAREPILRKCNIRGRERLPDKGRIREKLLIYGAAANFMILHLSKYVIKLLIRERE
jgi:hypothetical protein